MFFHTVGIAAPPGETSVGSGANSELLFLA